MMNSEYKGRIYVFGDYSLDAYDGRLERKGSQIALTPTLLEILLTLIHDAGHVVGKSEFLNRVWAGRVVEEGNLARNISTLRKILGDDPQNPRYIETAPGRGYRFLAEVTELSADATKPVAWEQPVPGRQTRSRAPLFVGAALVACAIAAAMFLIPGTDAERYSPIRSVVVLPFENMSGDPAQSYLAEGMTEELIATLGKIGELSVTSRTSSMFYQGSTKRLPDIARDLGVEGVIEGSVLRTGDDIRLSVRLVDAAFDRSLWSETFERKIGDAFLVHNEISGAIADALEIDVAPERVSRMVADKPIGEAAHEAYLLGLFFKNKSTVESLHTALSYFEEAIEAAPEFARAYAAMADTYLALASWQGPSRVLWPKARAAANAAIEIDRNVAEAHLVRAGAILCHDLDQAAAEPIYLRALELNPGNTTSIMRYSYSLMTQGRSAESIEWARKAVRLDPVSVALHTALGKRLYFAGDYDEALSQLDHALSLDPGFPETHRVLGWLHLRTGKLGDAILALEKAFALGGGQGVSGELGRAYALAGRSEDALRQLHALEELSHQGRDSAFSLALIHYGLGHDDVAIDWLEKAYGERDFRMIFLLVDPTWDNLRSHPRFRDLLVNIGLKAPPTA